MLSSSRVSGTIEPDWQDSVLRARAATSLSGGDGKYVNNVISEYDTSLSLNFASILWILGYTRGVYHIARTASKTFDNHFFLDYVK